MLTPGKEGDGRGRRICGRQERRETGEADEYVDAR
jgi:hypothetical protein